MPTSNLHNAPMICRMVRETGARTVLDVGPGHGKYGVLLREYAGVEVVDAVEMWEPYVEEFNLRGIYDEVLVSDVLDLPEEFFADYDAVLTVSSIEHMPKEPAIEWLRRIPGHVVIVTPRDWMQEDHPVPTERHQSLWTVQDFRTRFPRRAQKVQVERGAVIAHLGRRPE